MILLRFADLMDMSKDRVSLDIMKLNIKNMSERSKFHWISHSIIDKCEIKTNYTYNKPSEDNIENNINTYIKNDFFEEEIVFNIYLNVKNLLTIDSKKCENIYCKINKKENSFEIITNDKNNKFCCSESHTNKHLCILLCKWMKEKNNYFIQEIKSLNTYLNRNKNNLFKSTVKLKFHMEDIDTLDKEYLDIILKYLQE